MAVKTRRAAGSVRPPAVTALRAGRQARGGPREPAGPPGGPGAPLVVDPHDPHAVEVGGLPLTVMVGLALLPFAIPLVWLIAPFVAGRPPALTVATPAALAVAFAAMCLAVVFTVDWSPATRLKGVVVLLGLAYFAGLGLYFLRKEMVDRVAAAFGPRWQEFRPPDGAYRVELPHRPVPVPGEQPLRGWALSLHRAARPGWDGVFTCTVGAGRDARKDLDDDAWFAAVERVLLAGRNGAPVGARVAAGGGNVPGREWVIHQDRASARTVRVFRDRANEAVYYLAADDADDPALARRFFDSFRPLK
ncbi:MAG: hypothetical protein K2X82_14140 [Gemmataceae bacterium]|nr:hypothetical protein [Gemmataceae bacterium]